jgi:putative solute:sodium symporter small subunit
MRNASRSTAIGTAVAILTVQVERHFVAHQLKRGMLAMLAAWLGYFAVISLTVRSLNKVTVPLIEMPLGAFLVAQGTAIIFVAAVILLLKTAAITRIDC